jgi:hypothetical protein
MLLTISLINMIINYDNYHIANCLHLTYLTLRLLLIIIHSTTDNYRNSLIIDLSDNYRYLSPKKIS